MEKQLYKSNKLEYINVLRILALILVILAHSSAVYTGAWGFKLVNNKSKTIKYITKCFQTFRMPLFVFISGYLYHFNRVKLGKYKSFPEFVKKKAKRLLIPYLMVGILFMIPVQMIFNIYSDNESFFYKVVNEILLANMPGHLWFLLALFNIFMIFYLVEEYVNKKSIIFNKKGIVINFIILICIGFFTRNIPNFYQFQSSLEYFVFFYMGYVFSEYFEDIRNYVEKRRYVLFIHSAFFNIHYFLLNSIKNSALWFKGVRFLFRKITSMLGVTFMFMYSLKFCEDTERLDKFMNNSIIKLIDNNKFYTYLFHQPVLKIVLVNIGDIDISPFVVVNILFWSTLAISLLLAVVTKKIKGVLFR